MIFAVFTFIIYLFLKVIFDISFTKRIKQASDVDAEFRIRRKADLFSQYYVWIVGAIIILAFVLWVVLAKPEINEVIKSVVVYFILTVLIFALNGGLDTLNQFSNEKYSYMTRDSFLEKYLHFALYLRGFATDNRDIEQIDQKFLKKFSEYHLVKALKDDFETFCAVGMTKELNAPPGAERVYLSDETWEEDVRILMEKAERIFVLMNDSESCLWEIQNTVEFIEKTVFIVDDPVKYTKLIKEVPDFDFPSLMPTIQDLITQHGAFMVNPIFVLTQRTGEPWTISTMLNIADNYSVFFGQFSPIFDSEGISRP